MKNKKQITVIIPVYNCKNYLAECFDSIVNQTIGLGKLDVIIVDDGSTDGSDEVIKEYKKRYPKWKVIAQNNAGLAAARNAALEHLKTEYVCFFDSDDILPKTALASLLKSAEKNKSDIVIGGMENFTSAGHRPNYTTKYLRSFDRISYKEYIHLLDFVHACGKLYRTDVIKNKRFIAGTKHEDNYFTLSLYLSTDKISMIDKTVYCRRDREGNDKSITQSLDFNSFKDLLTNYSKALDENSYNEKVLKFLTRKIYRYIFKNLSKEDWPKAFKLAKIFRKEHTFFHGKNLPLVSIIIPTYRRARFLNRAIDSALNQTYPNIEIIVVDDNGEGTNDRISTEKIMENYKNKHSVIYIKHKQNKNGACARNTGIKEAKGEYITFLDDDDFFLNDRIQKLVEEMGKHPAYNCAYTNVIRIRNGRVYRLDKTPGSGNYKNELLAQHPLLGTGSNMFFRATTLKELGGFDTSFKRHQDLEIMVRFFRKNNILKLKNYTVVKDDSDRTNMKDISVLIESRKHFLETFEKDIATSKEKEKIYAKNYQSLLNRNHKLPSLNQITNKLRSFLPLTLFLNRKEKRNYLAISMNPRKK